MKKILLLLFFAILFHSCKQKEEPEKKSSPSFKILDNITAPVFSGSNAYALIEKQLKFGPRNPNSSGRTAAKYFLVQEFKKYADEVIEQDFSYTGYEGEVLSLKNIIARFNPTAKERIFISAHWDCRPRAEHDKDINKQTLPIPGANDGASGTAIILELSRLLYQNKINYGIDLILFDGEDYGKENDLNNFCLGSKYFAGNHIENFEPQFGILLDLVGDKEATFYKEGYSTNYAKDVVDLVWGIAAKINADRFSNFTGHAIYDDHIPLNQAGIKTIDIIDAELVGANTQNERRNYWHTQKDNISNIGLETLQQVGNVLTQLIYSLSFK